MSSKSAHTPVPGATVQVGDQKVVTDIDGRYTINEVSTGDAAVKVTADGYGPDTGRLNVQRGTNTPNVTLRNGTVNGTREENAEVTEPITRAKVTIAGKPAAVAKGGHFTATGVPVGTQTVVVAAPGHAAYTKQVTTSPGINDVCAVLNLTPVETYMRYYLGYGFGRYRDAYSLVHPDVRKHYSYKKFVKDMKASITLGVRVLAVHGLATWRASYAHKTYHHVVALDRAYHYQDGWRTWTDNSTQHFMQINGRWYIFFDWH